MNADGTMARMPQLMAFGEQHGIRVVTVADLIKHRMKTERVVVPEGDGELAVDGLGTWKTRLYRSVGSEGMHLALWRGDVSGESAPPVRVQPAPPAWAFLAPGSNTLSRSAREALEHIDAHGSGALVLMHLSPQLDALQRTFIRDVGGEVPEAVQLRADALRDLGTGCQILVDLGVTDMTLLSSSTRPIVGIEAYGLRIVERVPLG